MTVSQTRSSAVAERSRDASFIEYFAMPLKSLKVVRMIGDAENAGIENGGP